MAQLRSEASNRPSRQMAFTPCLVGTQYSAPSHRGTSTAPNKENYHR